MNIELSKAYDPKSTEEKIYRLWEESGCFKPGATSPKLKTKSYSVHLPPPNITGSLHMGHALNATISDILIRYHRMNGYKTVWFPGTDHAGIATQNVVEKNLKKEGASRWDLGREKFIEKVWEWKNKYGNIIIEQLKKLGASCDWSRLRFTMDSNYADAVKQAFIHYYERGLIYRGKKVVNWCPRCQTSLSDLEIEYKEEKGKLWYLKYPVIKEAQIGRSPEGSYYVNNISYIVVATTRPETMLGDAAVAVNPKDKRYKDLIGKKVLLPIQNREIPIVGDGAVDMEFGTGAIKVTPAHDMLDAEIGERHNLSQYQVIDERTKMTAEAGKEFEGLKVLEAREKVIKLLAEAKLLEKVEDFDHNLAVCYRCGATLESLLSNQWFLKMGDLAKKALKAVKSGKVKIIPENFQKPYFAWLENIKDWCISRQIWWGHQLPVWYKTEVGTEYEATHFKKEVLFQKLKLKDEAEFDAFSDLLLKNDKNVQWASNDSEIQIYLGYIKILKEEGLIDDNWVANNKIERLNRQGKMHVGETPPEPIGWMQETDVLDTWFSSALWPFAGLSEADLKDFYPSNVLITAREIINLWVARMIFSGLEFRGDIPFSDVLIHGTILTKDGKRMSKSLGTGIDPLELIEKYGADATRFGIIWQAMGTQDVHWDEAAVMAGKKFANKLWNIARFVIGRIENSQFHPATDEPRAQSRPKINNADDKEILNDLKKIKKIIEKNIKNYELGPALHALYDFIWHSFADKYIEASKSRTDDGAVATLRAVLDEILKMLHPFMPFITEEIFQTIKEGHQSLLMTESWSE